MLSFDELNKIGNHHNEITQRFYTEVLQDIARRIVITGRVTETAKHQIEVVNQAGLLREDIERRIAEYTYLSRREVKNVFREAAVKTIKYDNQAYKEVGKDIISTQTPEMINVLNADIAKMNKEIKNLSKTVTTTANDEFLRVTDTAHYHITRGSMSADQALKRACQQLAKDGIKALYYSTSDEKRRRIDLEAGIRRLLYTGAHQTARQAAFNGMVKNDCGHIEMSAHAGARNKGSGFENHESWQGKVYALNGFPIDKIFSVDYKERSTFISDFLSNRIEIDQNFPDFVESTGVGDVRGFAGANCYHDGGAFYPGFSERRYTDEQIESLNNATVEYNGKVIPLYDAKQIQRKNERNIRKFKHELAAIEAANEEIEDELSKIDTQDTKRKIREAQRKQRDFLREIGRENYRDYSREKVYN